MCLIVHSPSLQKHNQNSMRESPRERGGPKWVVGEGIQNAKCLAVWWRVRGGAKECTEIQNFFLKKKEKQLQNSKNDENEIKKSPQNGKIKKCEK